MTVTGPVEIAELGKTIRWKVTVKVEDQVVVETFKIEDQAERFAEDARKLIGGMA